MRVAEVERAVSMIGMTTRVVTEKYERQFWEEAVTLLLHPTQARPQTEVPRNLDDGWRSRISQGERMGLVCGYECLGQAAISRLAGICKCNRAHGCLVFAMGANGLGPISALRQGANKLWLCPPRYSYSSRSCLSWSVLRRGLESCGSSLANGFGIRSLRIDATGLLLGKKPAPLAPGFVSGIA